MSFVIFISLLVALAVSVSLLISTSIAKRIYKDFYTTEAFNMSEDEDDEPPQDDESRDICPVCESIKALL